MVLFKKNDEILYIFSESTCLQAGRILLDTQSFFAGKIEEG
jgi:hypothetical protein